MSPFAGGGANLAMLDAVELARVLVARSGDWEAAPVAYERDVVPHSARIAEVSVRYRKVFFGPIALVSVVDRFTRDERSSEV